MAEYALDANVKALAAAFGADQGDQDDRINAADAKAVAAQAVAVPHADYVAALAAATSAPTTQNRISAIVSGKLIEWVRQAGGPCLGGGWIPAGDVTPLHFGAVGDGVNDDRAAFAAMNAAGGKCYIPAPQVSWNVSSPINLDNVAVTADPSADWSALTSNGDISFFRGFFTDNISVSPNGANIVRIPDRIFAGDAAWSFAGNKGVDAGDFYLGANADGPAYIPLNGQYVFSAYTGDTQPKYSVVGAVFGTETNTRTLSALSAAVVNKGEGGGRGLLVEVQSEGATGTDWGAEIIVKNSVPGGVGRITPYTTDAAMVFNLQFGTGDDAFGSLQTGPNTAGIVFASKNFGYHSGIMFRNGVLAAIPGEAETEAIAMCPSNAIRWYGGSGQGVVGSIYSTAGDAAQRKSLRFSDGGLALFNANSKVMFASYNDAGHVNGIALQSNYAGAPVIIRPMGDDANINLRLEGKGTGTVQFGTHTAIGAETVTGYITVRDISGNIRKLAVIS